MKRALLQPSLSALLGLAIAASASADKIYLSDGSIINDARILTEGVKTVSYIPDGKKKKSDAKEVASELVLSIEYTQMPEDVAAAQVDADDEAFAAAVAGMEVYLENVAGKGDRKFPWAPAFARYRLVELYKLGGELPSMVTSADALVAEYPESRYVPLAMVEKIDALLGMGDVEQARGAIDALKAMVSSAGLPKRWEFEADVRKILTNPTLQGEGLEKELQSIVRAAAAFPTVSNFAAVARAESLVARGELAEAEKALRKVVGGQGALDRTLAAAYTALGESLFRRAEAADSRDEAAAAFAEAQLAFMRVVVNYRFEYAYVAKSAFYAGRCFQEIGGEGSSAKSRKLFTYVQRRFKESRWANEARAFNRRN